MSQPLFETGLAGLLFVFSLFCIGCTPSQPVESRISPSESGVEAPSEPVPSSLEVSDDKVIKVGFSFAKPPYVFAQQFDDLDPYSTPNAPLGFEVDIFKAALDKTGYKFKPVFQTFARVIADLSNGSLDAAETSGDPQPGIFYSQAIIGCENYVVTRKSDDFTLNALSDLSSLKMVGWQGASTDLGPAFTTVVKDNPNYFENVNQEAQYQMFSEGRVDALVIDKYIFQWWHNQHALRTGKKIDVVYHPLFPGVNQYFMGFRDKAIRDAFDIQLLHLRASGEYDRIIATYSGVAPTPTVSSITKAEVPLSVMFGVSRPPFVMEREHRGFCVDLASEAFRRMGVSFTASFASNRRMEEELISGNVDIGVEVQQFSTELHYSKAFITYSNIVLSRRRDNLVFRSWKDLQGKRVGAWQMASENLGKDFSSVIDQYSEYTEFPSQIDQVYAWVNGNCDVLVIDKRMVLWHLAQLAEAFPDLKVPDTDELAMAPVPAPSDLDWFVGFRSSGLRDRFDEVLETIHGDGTHDRILAKYWPGGKI
jgi:polar amino acid transport system substrate-binding protein